MQHRLIVIYPLSLLMLSNPALSVGEPVVIYNNGQAKPLPNQPQTLRYHSPVPADFKAPLEPLPVKTEAMTPGPVQARHIDRSSLNRPVFIVGFDPMSLQWLKRHHLQLKQIKATGIAVNVESNAQLNTLRQAVAGLEINPVAGDTIAQQLQLRHYPVLISQSRIEQ